MRRLGELVRARVHEAHGIELRFEIEFVGDWAGWEEAA